MVREILVLTLVGQPSALTLTSYVPAATLEPTVSVRLLEFPVVAFGVKTPEMFVLEAAPTGEVPLPSMLRFRAWVQFAPRSNSSATFLFAPAAIETGFGTPWVGN